MNNPYKGRTGWKRLWSAAGNSWSGLRTSLQSESALRQEATLALVLLPASWWLGRNWPEIALLAGSVLLVLIVELLNTAVEITIDRIGFEANELSRRAKDTASAAVLLSLLLCAGIWVAALRQHFRP